MDTKRLAGLALVRAARAVTYRDGHAAVDTWQIDPRRTVGAPAAPRPRALDA